MNSFLAYGLADEVQWNSPHRLKIYLDFFLIGVGFEELPTLLLFTDIQTGNNINIYQSNNLLKTNTNL